MIIVYKFHDPSIIGSRDTEGGGGPRSPPPPLAQSQIDQKSPVWIGLSSTLIHTSELILCSTICVPSATRHNIHMYP